MYWRVISVDGHPVRGAFTFAVGPNPGPAPQFVIPSISETAATPGLLIARWAVFLSVMAAIGLFVFRAVIARPVRQRVPGSSLRAVTLVFLVAVAVALVATPIYVFAATAKFALRSIWDISALTPLLRASAFGRGFLDLELILALFAIAAIVLLRVERPEARQRPVAEMLALVGALLAAAAAVSSRGSRGTRPRRRRAESRSRSTGSTSPRARSGSVGYWNRPDATAETIAGGWLDTATSCPPTNRTLPLVPRPQKTNHHSRRLEHLPAGSRRLAARASCGRVRGVIGVHDLIHGENVRAYVTLKPDTKPPTTAELIQFSKTLVGYKAPDEIFVLDEMPTTAVGKVDRVA